MAKMASTSDSRYDLVVFGATGFTGQYVVEEVARVAQLEQQKSHGLLKWAIAGRNESKLMNSLAVANEVTGANLTDVGTIVADVGDQDSLQVMASQAKVVINCVGPYQKFGEPVVKACIDQGASHVDISGETQYLEEMQLKYDKAAEEAGTHIVGSCGYDSIPAEMGVNILLKNFKGDVNSVECYMRTSAGGAKAPIHTGTMESAAMAIANQSKIGEIRQKLFPQKLPKPKYRKEERGIIHKNETLNAWALPLPTDEPVVYRTQRYRLETLGLRPVQYQGFVSVKTLPQAVGMLFGGLYFILMCYFSFTRSLLIKFPEFFTAGVFSRAGGKREELSKVSFTSTLIGKGWSEKLAESTDEYAHPPDASAVVKISGPDPGYGATSLMLVASAMTILREKDRCTRRGGVMTPGIAFMNTDLVSRLTERGMTVHVDKN